MTNKTKLSTIRKTTLAISTVALLMGVATPVTFAEESHTTKTTANQKVAKSPYKIVKAPIVGTDKAKKEVEKKVTKKSKKKVVKKANKKEKKKSSTKVTKKNIKSISSKSTNKKVETKTKVEGDFTKLKALADDENKIVSTTNTLKDNDTGVNEATTIHRPTAEELAARKGLESNNDIERRDTLSKTYGVSLSDKDVWEDKAGKTTKDADGVVREYTSHDEMKADGIYATNANRQELILYAVRTGDWQPYRASEAKLRPADFVLVNGKYEYSKIYWGQMLMNEVWNFKEREATLNGSDLEEAKATHERMMKEYIQDFNAAEGVVMYIVGVNNTVELANENGVPTPDKNWVDSHWNNPDITLNGQLPDGLTLDNLSSDPLYKK